MISLLVEVSFRKVWFPSFIWNANRSENSMTINILCLTRRVVSIGIHPWFTRLLVLPTKRRLEWALNKFSHLYNTLVEYINVSISHYRNFNTSVHYRVHGSDSNNLILRSNNMTVDACTTLYCILYYESEYEHRHRYSHRRCYLTHVCMFEQKLKCQMTSV